MTHQPYRDWLAVRDADLAPDRRAALASHLDSCVQCRALRDGLAQLDRILADPPLVPAPAGFALRFQGRLAARESRPRWLLGGAALGFGVLGVLAALGLALAPLLAGAVALVSQPGALTGVLSSLESLLGVVVAVAEAVLTGLRVLLGYLSSQPAVAAFTAAGLGVLVVWVETLRRFAPQGGRVR